jgi:E3 ubiquitin-protein ligase TRIP12
MMVMQNLVHQPKNHVEEALSLIVKLLPPLLKGMLYTTTSMVLYAQFCMLDGIYKHKVYTEKSLRRMMKAKVKAECAVVHHVQQMQLYALIGTSTLSSSASATHRPPLETVMPTPVDSLHEADESPSMS